MILLQALIGGMIGIIVPLLTYLGAKRLRRAMADKTAAEAVRTGAEARRADAEARKTDAEANQIVSDTWAGINGTVVQRLTTVEKENQELRNTNSKLQDDNEELREHLGKHDDEMHELKQENARLTEEIRVIKARLGDDT